MGEASELEIFHRLYLRAVSGMDFVRLGHWERFGLTLPQLRVIFWLRRNPGATVRDLARALGVTMPTTSALVQKLVERGLVERGKDASDRRLVPLTLTDQGAALAGLARADSLAFAERLAARLGPALPRVTEALAVLAEAVEATVEATARVRAPAEAGGRP